MRISIQHISYDGGQNTNQRDSINTRHFTNQCVSDMATGHWSSGNIVQERNAISMPFTRPYIT